ncbi:hypothetical protein FB45DRAFT_939933 [Roridomyces roridus]|uniref:F-box domain-containing protein n=1 Tax=Roridomyces roridus TaxID=1738132 RepID=A0AAD7FD81_9AGAR|nr:hypothetical protein FB45DRAFT_939933 [Roridomyces roridus]
MSRLPDGDSFLSAPPHALRAHLSEIDAETAQLRARPAFLAGKRESIVDALQSVTYPSILALPAEIVAEIFLNCVGSGYARIGRADLELGISTQPLEPCAPLLLASACRRWREIALFLQPIWSSIDIQTAWTAMASAENILARWLPRTGTHPLTVSIRSFNSDLLSFLSPFMHKLQHFQCFIDAEQDLFPSKLCEERLTLLRRLDVASFVNDEDEGFEVDPSIHVTTFENCPLLRRVSLTSFPRDWISLPWELLIHLELHELYDDQCMEILKDTLALETLVLSVLPSDGISWGAAPLRLPHLHTLRFTRYQSELDILTNIDLPSLTHVDLALMKRPGSLEPEVSENATHFQDFVLRSACSLRSITLMCPTIEDTIACLRAAGRTLSVVKLQDIYWHIRDLNRFMRTLKSADFIPNLTSLAVGPCSSAIEVPYGDLAALLAFRRQDHGEGTARLESFELVLGGSLPPNSPQPTLAELDDGLSALRTLEDDGLKLDIRCLQKMTRAVLFSFACS